MPKVSVLQASFTSGEVSPLYYGQADNPRYKKGLQTAQNVLPLLQGPIIRRPGTKFCAQSLFLEPPVLIPFVFSETQSYILEFGDGYIRFYANNGQIVTSGASFQVSGHMVTRPDYIASNLGVYGRFYGTRANKFLQIDEADLTAFSIAPGSTLTVISPYLQADLPLIRWAQNADTLYLVHPSYPPYKLQRQGQTYWRLSPVIFKDGPYLPLNSYTTIGDSANFNMKVSSFSTTPYGSVALQMLSTPISGAMTDPMGSGQIQITTTTAHGMLTGQNVFIEGVVGTVEANNWDSMSNPGATKAYWPIAVTSPTTFLLSGSTFVHAYGSGGNTYPALFALSAQAYRDGVNPLPDAGRTIAFIISGVRYYAYLSLNINPPINAATWRALWPLAPNSLPSTTITAWQLGVYSPGQGFPRCTVFHQNRLCFAGPGVAPQEVDLSMSGKYETFSPSDPTTLAVSDNNALSFQLNSSDANFIQWVASTAQGLLAGTYVSEWVMTPSSGGEALTPTNFNAQQSSYYGGALTAAVQIGNGTFYIQRAQRKVREMSFFFQAGTFRSIEMTEISEHITIPEVIQLAVTKETQPLIWGVLSDGSLVSMIYNRDDLSLIAGWTRHKLGGQSDAAGTIPIVSSIASIPSPDLTFDQLWLVVQRYINGQTVYNIEYMTKIFDDTFAQEDAFQLDGGGTFYNPMTISAITTGATTVVTASSLTSLFAGFSNGDRIRFAGVIGFNKSTIDSYGNITASNLLNGQEFAVGGVTNTIIGPNTISVFTLYAIGPSALILGPAISSVGYGAYVSGGFVAKMVTVVSGLTWLKGETVSLLLDGGLTSPVTVSNVGQIILPFAASKVQVGYPFLSQVQPLRADAGSPDGSSIGKTRRTTRLAVQMHKSGDLALGTSFSNLIPVELGQVDVDQADQPMPLFSGMIREGLESAYDFESTPCLQMSSALPGCIQSLTSLMEEFDV